jgi:hypothetical protein
VLGHPVIDTQPPADRWYPALHTKSHDVPLHVAVAFAGVGQAVHDEPQVATLPSETHAPPQTWEPGLQVTPHWKPAHDATPPVGAGQTTLQSPQWFGSVLRSTHDGQAVRPAPHV